MCDGPADRRAFREGQGAPCSGVAIEDGVGKGHLTAAPRPPPLTMGPMATNVGFVGGLAGVIGPSAADQTSQIGPPLALQAPRSPLLTVGP